MTSRSSDGRPADTPKARKRPASPDRDLASALLATSGKLPADAKAYDWLLALAARLRERIAAEWTAHPEQRRRRTKEANYLSIEFLPGRLLIDTLNNLDLLDACRSELEALGWRLEDLAAAEPEPGLGNGGLGRLASCLLDSFATLGLPVWGYGIRYEHGLFLQRVEQGRQVELPDRWLRLGCPWEFPRPETAYVVPFHGRMEGSVGADGRVATRWVDADRVSAMAYDLPVVGYRSGQVNTLRLWSVVPAGGAPGEADDITREHGWDEGISEVLYPNDKTEAGRELRLRQEFFLVSASLQDILARHEARGRPLDALASHVSIHINDTHPALAVAELMRLLVDRHRFAWSRAWEITRAVCSYTNHTLMPEALETWPTRFFEALLPRHLEIIYEINEWLLEEVETRRPGDMALLRHLSLIDEDRERRVRMGHLAFAGSHRVNGVSRMHAKLMKRSVFAEFDRVFPDRIIGITNGVSPRRWLCTANPGLSALVTAAIGEGWQTDLLRLRELDELAADGSFRIRFQAVKTANKQRLAELVERRTGLRIDTGAMLDVHVKRIHEYKRQLLKLLHCIVLYRRIRDGNPDATQPRTVLFAGKAAPGYERAKLIIKLIHDVAAVANADPRVRERLRILFLPNYGVSDAERIVAAAELSEQISTAGTEASGTGNMKLGLNGAITVGTLDGANVEMLEAVGPESMFIFGNRVEQLAELREYGYHPIVYRDSCPELGGALDLIASGHFSPEAPALYRPIVEDLTTGGDRYFLLADFADYLACQDRIETLYRNPREWMRRSIRNVARLGSMSSDRAARQYAAEIWGILPAAVGARPVPAV